MTNEHRQIILKDSVNVIEGDSEIVTVGQEMKGIGIWMYTR